MAASLQYIVEPDEVRLDISLGIGDGIANTGLRCQVDDNSRTILTEDIVNRLFVGNVTLDEHPAVVFLTVKSLYLTQTKLLERRVVIVIHIVDAHDGGTLHVSKQTFDQIAAYESSSTRHENAFMI